MRFHLEHRFDASVDRVAQAVLERSYQDRLEELPNVAERVVKEQTERPDGTIQRIVYYRFEGQIPGPVRKVIGGDRVSWDEHATYDPSAHTWRFEIRPHVFEKGFECRGTMVYRAEGSGTVREVTGDIKVKVPIVGGRVEKVIRDGLVESMDAEAEILVGYLERSEATS